MSNSQSNVMNNIMGKLKPFIAIAAVIAFGILFAVIPGFVEKSLFMGFFLVSVVWAVMEWGVSLEAFDIDRDNFQIEKILFGFTIKSMVAFLIMALCIGVGFLIVFLLSQVPEIKDWIS